MRLLPSVHAAHTPGEPGGDVSTYSYPRQVSESGDRSSWPRVELQLPPWFWGGNPAKLVDEAELHTRHDRSSGRASIQTNESYTRRRPNLVSVLDLAGHGIPHDRFARLAGLHELAEHDLPAEVREAIASRRSRAEETGAPVDAIAFMQLELMTSSMSALEQTARRHFEQLREIGLEGQPSTKVFASASSHLITRSPALLWRAKLASILVQLGQDLEMQEGHIAHLLTGAYADGGLAFQSSSSLQEGLYIFDAYLGPMLGALSPSVWAVAATRSFGNIVTALGQPLADAGGEAVELLQLINVPGATEVYDVPSLDAGASGDAVRWWTDRLDAFFGVLTDPAVFSSAAGKYVPESHMHAILSAEQLFRRMTSLQLAHRDTHARRVLFFSVLDTLERLTNRRIDVHCSLHKASETLAAVRSAMPPTAGQVLMPMADRGVAALKALQDGWFYTSQLRPEQAEVVLQLRPAGEKRLSIDKATWMYVKALRDATHGHGSDKKDVAPRTNALLAQHNGHVHHDLGLLGYLYLLDLLCHPERLRDVLRASARKVS
jgi:hypothetical protein